MAEEPGPVHPEDEIVTFNKDRLHLIPGRDIPSYWSNRYHVLMGDEVARISFGCAVVSDQDDVPMHYCVTMPRVAALHLANLILKIAESAPAGPDGEKS